MILSCGDKVIINPSILSGRIRVFRVDKVLSDGAKVSDDTEGPFFFYKVFLIKVGSYE